jgi:hypothetical protein
MAVAKTHQDQLERIKTNIKESHDDFNWNRSRFHSSKDFIFNTSITESDKSVLKITLKPQIESNIIEPHISRLCGEYAKQEPSLNVSSADGQQIDPALIEFLDGHFRWMLHEANNDGMQYNTYLDQLGGGYSTMQVKTAYESERSLDQIIKLCKPDDATMTGFDPLAKKPHKGDGRYWFNLYPKTLTEFKEEYSDIATDEVNFCRQDLGTFTWSYTTERQEKVLLIGEYFEKKKRKAKLVKLSNDQTMLEDEYEDFVAQWNEAIQKGLTIQQPPVVVDSRKTMITTVCRYVLIETEILEYSETDFDMLNGVFVDGNSVWLKEGGGTGANKQMTRPYAWQAFGIQRLKNFAMQCLGAELENMVQHKWIIPIEGLPLQEEYRQVYSNNQIPNNVMYNAYYDKDTNKPLPPPQAVVRPPIPPEITNTFMMCDQALQVILGSGDTSIGANDSGESGKAVIAKVTQSNSAAMPYIVGNLAALNQIGQIVVSLIPKIHKTPRSLPVIDKQGKRSYVTVNGDSGLKLNYDASKLHVRVDAGVNFHVQQQQALQQLVTLANADQMFATFINTKCLDVLVDNLDVRGADILKQRAEQFMQQMEQQQQQSSQQPNPLQIKAQIEQQKLSIAQQKNQNEMILGTAKVQNEKESIDNDRLEIMLEAEQAKRKDVVEMAKANAEDERSRADLGLKAHDQALKHVDQSHRHTKETIELANQLSQPQPTTQLTGENNG